MRMTKSKNRRYKARAEATLAKIWHKDLSRVVGRLNEQSRFFEIETERPRLRLVK
jgi:hypothetical protein